MGRALAVRLFALCVALGGVGSGVAQAPTLIARSGPPPVRQAYESDKKYIGAIRDATDAENHGMNEMAIGYLRKANKVAEGRCVDCLEQIYDLQMKTKEYKDAAGSAVALEGLATDAGGRSLAVAQQARALYEMAGKKPKPAQLEAVHALYQTALAEYPKNLPARFSDGCVLARMGQMEDAGKQFAVCAQAASPTDPTRVRARHFAANPALSLEKMAPAFTVTALDGSKFTLDEMGGKVVLIDFWATWCGPCNEELPQMKKIAREFAGQPLVILSISWDSDEAAWKAFIAKNEMTWMQYRDGKHELTNRFGVEAIPHYFTIDSDGVLTSEMLGSGSDVEGKLKKLLAKARAEKAPAVVLAAGS